MDLLTYLNFILSLGGLFLLAVTTVLYIDFFLWHGKYFSKKAQEYLWPTLIAVTVGSIVISLTYSEYFGFIPCSLCWLQRIAIYPQALLAILAFRHKDKEYFPLYGIGLSVFGLIVALYQYIEQMWPKATTTTGNIMPCLVDGSNADCAQKVIDQFGFVTFPFLSAITFAFLIILYLYMRHSNKHNHV